MPKLDIQRSATGVPERISMGAGNLSREHLHLSTLYPVAGNKSGFASRLYETFQGVKIWQNLAHLPHRVVQTQLRHEQKEL